jgi:hypothetical protein
MRRNAIIFLLLTLTFACSNEDNEMIEVKYEVTTTSGKWFGEYIDETGEKICFCSQPLPASGWTYTFKVANTPFTLHIDASSECCVGQVGSPDVTTNIYVNKKLVSTNTSNWAPGLASADFEIE